MAIHWKTPKNSSSYYHCSSLSIFSSQDNGRSTPQLYAAWNLVIYQGAQYMPRTHSHKIYVHTLFLTHPRLQKDSTVSKLLTISRKYNNSQRSHGVE